MTELSHDDVVSILDYFAELEDPRSDINRKHLLGDIIVISICATCAGAEGPKAVGLWAQSNELWLKSSLELPNGIPSHDTIGRLLALLKPEAFQKCFRKWIASLRSSGDDGQSQFDDIIAIDGKALRRSHDRKRGLGPLFLVSAWCVNRGISLGQLATAEKSNEITAIPELLDDIDIEGAIVTIDAAGCQKSIAAKIINGGGDFVLALKGNQKKLYNSVVRHIEAQIANNFENVTVRRYTEVVKGHGRVDTIEYCQFKIPASISGQTIWKNINTVGIATRTSVQGDKETVEVRYYISSLALGVKRFAAAVRGHWGIENSLHWCLDVTFREDESRVRERNAANNLAWLKRFAISLLKQQNDKETIAMRRRKAGWDPSYLAQVIGLQRS